MDQGNILQFSPFTSANSQLPDFEVGFTGKRKYTLDELKNDIKDGEKAIEWRKKNMEDNLNTWAGCLV